MTDSKGAVVRLADDRHQFVVDNLPLAYYLVRVAVRKLAPGGVPEDEVHGLGHLAAVDAMARWDDRPGVKYSSWLWYFAMKYVSQAASQSRRWPRRLVGDVGDAGGGSGPGLDYDEADRLAERLGRLQGRDREVLERSYGRGDRQSEVAAALGISRERVGQVRRRGMRRLRELYGVPARPAGEGAA